MVGDTGMKQTFKVKLVTGLFGTFLALGAAAIVGYQPQNAYADAAANGFQMVEGASVRLTDENRGIRFAAQFGEDFYNEAAEYHMMIIPAPLVDKYSLTHDSDFYKVLVEQNKLNVAVTDCLPEEKDGAYRIYGSLTDILYQNSNRTFFGVAYRELAGERVYASYIDGQNERTICEVASKALNDLSARHSEDDKNYLLGMINDAYKNELGLGKDDTPETALKDALSVKASADNFIATKGDKISLGDTIVSVNSEVTDKLNLSLGVYSADETIVNAGKGFALTAAADKSGMTSVGSVLLGEKVAASERKVMVRSEMAGNMLEDYADECSAKPFGSDKQSFINGGGTAGATTWLETYEGRNGVIKMKSGIGGNSGVVRYFYNRSYEEMINLDFDYISIWAYFDNLGEGNETVTVKNGSLVLGEAIAPKKWVELKISKEQINSASSWNKTYENYCARHDAAEKHGDVENNGTMIFSTSLEGIDVYLDSVSFAKFSVPEYTVPAGGDFELPAVKMVGINGENLEINSQISASFTYYDAMKMKYNITLTEEVVDNKIKIHTGKYKVKYLFNDGLTTYEKVLDEFQGTAVEVSGNMLEDFNDPTRTHNLERYNNNTTKNTKWFSYFEGRYGVVSATNDNGSSSAIRFAKTKDELNALDFDYITVDAWFDYEGSLNISTASGETQVVSGKQWVQIILTKEQIVNNKSNFYNSNAANQNEGGGIKAFAFRHYSGGSGNYLFSIGTWNVTYYIDSISFGKNA